MDNAELEVLIRVRQAGLEVFRDMKDAMADLRREAFMTNLILRSMAMMDALPGGGGGTAGGGGGGGGNTIMDFLKGIVGPGGLQGWSAWAAAIAIVMAALLPFSQVLLSGTVMLISFTAGLAGVVAIAALAGAAFAAIGAGIFALGISAMGGADPLAALEKAQIKAATAADQLAKAQDAVVDFQKVHRGQQLTIAQYEQYQDLLLRLSQAQQKFNDAQGAVAQGQAAASNPMGKLRQDLETLMGALQQASVPITAFFLVWVDKAIPAIQTFGQFMIDWFSTRLPAAMKAFENIIKALGPDLQAFGMWLSEAFDRAAKLPWTDLIVAAIRNGVIPAIEGLITNLFRLSDWFIKNLPDWGPKVKQAFGWLGDAVQWIADNWGRLTDFVSQNWVKTMQQGKDFATALGNWWAANKDNVATIVKDLTDLLPYVDKLLVMIINVATLMDKLGAGNFIQALTAPIWLLARALDALAAAMDHVNTAGEGNVKKYLGDNPPDPSKRPLPGAVQNYPGQPGGPPVSNTVNTVYVTGANLSDPAATSRAVSRGLRLTSAT